MPHFRQPHHPIAPTHNEQPPRPALGRSGCFITIPTPAQAPAAELAAILSADMSTQEKARAILDNAAATRQIQELSGKPLSGYQAQQLTQISNILSDPSVVYDLQQATTGGIVEAGVVSPGEKSTVETGRGGGRGNKDTVTYRRVQGGQGTQLSQQRVMIDNDGNVYINKKDRNLNLSVDDGEHSQYFLNKRPGADIYEFELPKWFDDMVQECLIPQGGYKNNPLNQGGSAPKLTDITTPGRSIEFPAPWVEWIEEYAMSGRIVKGDSDQWSG